MFWTLYTQPVRLYTVLNVAQAHIRRLVRTEPIQYTLQDTLVTDQDELPPRGCKRAWQETSRAREHVGQAPRELVRRHIH